MLRFYVNVGSDTVQYDDDKRAQAAFFLTEMGKTAWYKAPWWWRMKSGGTVSLVNGDTYGAMPSDFSHLGEEGQIYIQNYQYAPLVPQEPDTIFFWRRTAPQTGRPQFYTLHERTVAGVSRLHIFPTADTSYTLLVDNYVKRVPDFIDRPGAPSVTAGAAGTPSGAYRWLVTFVTALGETEGGAVSASLTLSSQRAELSSIPISPARSVTERKIYRTEAGGLVYKLTGTISDNVTTTFTDNTADGSLGATAPTSAEATGTGTEQFPDDLIESLFVKGLAVPMATSSGDVRDLRWMEQWEKDVTRFWGEFQQGHNKPISMPRFGVVKSIGGAGISPRYRFNV